MAPQPCHAAIARRALLRFETLAGSLSIIDLTADETLGLTETEAVFEVRRLHPHEEMLGDIRFGETIEVRVEPFHSALIRITTGRDFGLRGSPYEIVRDVEGAPLKIDLIGPPGQTASIQLQDASETISAKIDGQPVAISENRLSVTFDGTPLTEPAHRALGIMERIELPVDAETLYEATVYSADNNALEVRSLVRSGPTEHQPVQAARDAFFKQGLFVDRGVWDKNLFDGDPNTAFCVSNSWPYWWNQAPDDTTINDGTFRLDLGKTEQIDHIVLTTRDEFTLAPVKRGEGVIAEISTDLKTWTEVRFTAGNEMVISMPELNMPVRYLRIREDAPRWLSEVAAYRSNIALNRSGWRASNLFSAFGRMAFTTAWQLKTSLAEIAPESYLSITIPGDTGHESVYAALKVDGDYVGAPDRAPSYPANTWELQVHPVEGNYTYYIPLQPDWAGRDLEIVLLGKKVQKMLSLKSG